MGRTGRRYYRTFVLGVLALGALIWVAVDQFEISVNEVTSLFVGALLATVMVIGAAAAVTLLWTGLRRLLRRDRD